MSFLQFLNHWWNVPFLVMLGLVAVFLVLQLVGVLGDAGDHDHDLDHDHDVDAHHDGDGGGGSSLLAYFGVGRVPFMVIWITFFLFTGIIGLFLNRLYSVRHGGELTGWFFAVSTGVSLAVGLVAVKVFSKIVGRFVDTGGKGSSSKLELCGKVGVVATTRLDEQFGEIRIHDPRGNEMIVHARIGKGEAPLARGARVVLVEYDDKNDLFWATASPAEAEAQG